MAIVTRRFSPPLIPFTTSLPTRLSAQSRRPIFRSTDSARCCFSSFERWAGRRRPAAKCRFSRTVRYGRSASSSWQTYEQIERTTFSDGIAPLKNISPRVSYLVAIELCRRLAMRLSKEVLPDPEGPMITLSTPGSKVVLRGFRIESLGTFLNRALRFWISRV